MPGYIGRRPLNPKYQFLGEAKAHGATWRVYGYKEGKTSHLKVAARGYVKHKANYMLRWNGSKLYGVGYKVLAEHRPALEKEVVNLLQHCT